MKLGTSMESGKPDTNVAIHGTAEKVDSSSKYTTKRLVGGVVIALVVLATVAGIILVSIYFGSKITSDSYKLVHQTFKTEDGQVVEEETIVTDTEVDIKIPNQSEVIYDYKQGIFVQRFTDPQTKLQSACYARFINETHAPSTDPEKYSDGQVTLHKRADGNGSTTTQWRITDREVHESLVSENVARMCEGTSIYWMEKEHSDGISKRSNDCVNGTKETFIVYVPHYYYYCIWLIFEDTFCVTNDVWEYLYSDYLGYYCNIYCDPYCYYY